MIFHFHITLLTREKKIRVLFGSLLAYLYFCKQKYKKLIKVMTKDSY